MEAVSKVALGGGTASGEALAEDRCPPARFPFLSDEWLAVVADVVAAQVFALGDAGRQIDYTINERFPGEPTSVAGKIGKVSIRRGLRPDPDRQVETEWNAAVRAVLTSDESAYRRVLADRIERGVAVVTGRATGIRALQGLHQMISVRTGAPHQA